VGLLVETWPESWHRSRLFRLLSLGGYVAFDLPRLVTGLGATLLLGIATAHVYIVAHEPALPVYFVGYAVAMIAGCLAVAGTLVFGRDSPVAQAGWYFGDLLSIVFLGIAVGTRMVSLPGLAALTGRWDVVPVTFALVFAAAFIAVHGSVLVGINVAYPQRQQWND
jgi:hypothetical protein